MFYWTLLIVYACDLLILVPQVVYCLHSQIIIYMYVNYCCVGHLIVRVYQSLYLLQVCPIPRIYLLKGWRQDIHVPALGLKSRYPNAPSGKLRDPRAQGTGRQRSSCKSLLDGFKETIPETDRGTTRSNVLQNLLWTYCKTEHYTMVMMKKNCLCQNPKCM